MRFLPLLTERSFLFRTAKIVFMKRTLQIANIIGFISVVIVNVLGGTGAINATSIADISNANHNLFTPAGYAFSIWSLIYLLLLGFIIYQSRGLFKPVGDDGFILKTGWWFVVSCFANIMWITFWVYGFMEYSILAIFVLLFSLIRIVIKNKMELWDAPISVILFLWWPFVIYSGWVTVASIANVSAYLKSINWDGWGYSEISWTITMIIIAGIINLAITWKRNMREFGLVGAWALIAISVANWETSSTVANTALVVAILLIISSGYHGYLNRATSLGIKYRQYKHRAQ